MHRRSRARRRFHTDRVVSARRARYRREWPAWRGGFNYPWQADEWAGRRLAYGRLASSDPWDCGRARCGLCHFEKRLPGQRRAVENRTWRREEDL